MIKIPGIEDRLNLFKESIPSVSQKNISKSSFIDLFPGFIGCLFFNSENFIGPNISQPDVTLLTVLPVLNGSFLI